VRKQAVIAHRDGHARRDKIEEQQRKLGGRHAAIVNIERRSDDRNNVKYEKKDEPEPSDFALGQGVFVGNTAVRLHRHRIPEAALKLRRELDLCCRTENKPKQAARLQS
jgi:hypothetical protein